MPTGIPYLDEVVNVTVGCSGKGCKSLITCWARELHDRRHRAYLKGKRLPAQYAKPFNEIQFFPERLQKILRWKKPKRIGISFTGDLFDEQVKNEWIDQTLCVIAYSQIHQFFLLTKQPQRMLEYSKRHGYPGRLQGAHILNGGMRLWTQNNSPFGNQLSGWPLGNLYWGVSVCDQADADRMIPELLRIPGKHWVSWEPAIGPVNFRSISKPGQGTVKASVIDRHGYYCGLDWVVVGCESGPKKRPCKIEWMIEVVNQCKEANVPVFVKQVDIAGKVVHDINKFPKELQIRQIVGDYNV